MARKNQPATRPTISEAKQQIAQHVVNELGELSLALQGAAGKMDDGAPRDDLLIHRAGWSIVHASCEGLVGALVDLSAILPESSILVDQYRAERPPPSSALNRRASPTISARTNDAIKAEIAAMLSATAGDRDEIGEVLHRLVAEVWRHLSKLLPGKLSPEVAYIKNEFLPGVDPWLGQARDFRKAGWALAVLADHIGQVWLSAHRHDLPVGFVRTEEIRTLHPDLSDVEFDRVRKNLENWRKIHEDRVIMGDENPESGYRRYAYPLAIVEEFVSKAMRSRKKG